MFKWPACFYSVWFSQLFKDLTLGVNANSLGFLGSTTIGYGSKIKCLRLDLIEDATIATIRSTTSAPVAMFSAASCMTPRVWKEKTQSSRSQTAGCNKSSRKSTKTRHKFKMMTSSIRIVGESRTLMSVEVLMRSLLEFPTTLSLKYFCCFTSGLK